MMSAAFIYHVIAADVLIATVWGLLIKFIDSRKTNAR
jgi:hypothetical protein